MGFARHLLASLRRNLALANPLTNGARRDSSSQDEEALLRGTGGYDADSGKGGLAPSRIYVDAALQRLLSSRFLRRFPFVLRVIDALIFGANVTLGFLNMLVVMSYNPGIMMAIVTGEVLGVLLLESPGGVDVAYGELEVRDVCCH